MGIDGVAWPGADEFESEFRILVGPASTYRAVSAYYRWISSQAECDLIYIAGPGPAPRGLPGDFVFRGYDYGYYISEYCSFSALFHDLIWGQYDSLRSYASLLNDGLLFPSTDSLVPVARERKRLVEEGADLETDEPMGPIAVWSPPHSLAGAV